MDESLIQSLRDAVQQSPRNTPLRLSLAQILLKALRYEEAEAEFRAGLEHAPDESNLRTGLAEAFYAQGKFSAALVIGEELVRGNRGSARTFLLMARCYAKEDDAARAVDAYRRARAIDPSIEDDELAHLDGAAESDDAADDLAIAGIEDLGAYEPDTERPPISFGDVGGMEPLKEEIRLKIIHPLTHPEIYAAYGKKIGGGILLFGPPGCGKTHLARATAGEVKARFLTVSISDVLDMYIGQSERNLHDIFERARQQRPAVLFFDEVDALAASRRDMRQSAGRQTINQFLAELDGIEADNEGLLIMAATNAPWHLDTAFRRPGRFDRILFVPPPDEPARKAILQVLLAEKPAQDVDVGAVAHKTPEYSGADLKAVIDLAVEEKLKKAIRSGVPEPLTTKDLLKAAKKVKPTTKEWFSTARNHALYANTGGFYDDILDYLGIR